MKKTAVACIALLCVSLFIPPYSAANSAPAQVENEQVNPSDGYKYIFKRAREKITLIVLSAMPGRKADYYEQLLTTRLAELQKIIKNKEVAFIEDGTKRYFTTAGQYTEFLNAKNLSERKGKARETLASHKALVDELSKTFNDTTAEWRFVKHDSDYLTIYINQLAE